MTQRKGLTAGSGRKGYYNIQGKDPLVHRQSAMGIKQPQNIINLYNKEGQRTSTAQRPTQNKVAVQIGRVKDYNYQPKYKVYANDNKVVIGGKGNRKDIGYYAIMEGGMPMTPAGARRFLIAAQADGYSMGECLRYIPNELLSDKAKEDKIRLNKGGKSSLGGFNSFASNYLATQPARTYVATNPKYREHTKNKKAKPKESFLDSIFGGKCSCGGKCGGKCNPSDLKHGTDSDSQFNSTELQKGIKVETEHTNDKSLAKAIAKAHLKEMPDYYKKLAKMEGKKSPKEVHVKSIEIRRAEGSRVADPLLGTWQKFDNVTDADARLAQISSTAPESGGYDKTDVKVTFDNGETYEGRWDVKHFTQPDNDTSIRQHIKDELNFYAGNTERGRQYIKNMGYAKSSTRKYAKALREWKLE